MKKKLLYAALLAALIAASVTETAAQTAYVVTTYIKGLFLMQNAATARAYLGISGAPTSLTNFNANQFSTNSSIVSIKSGALVTNLTMGNYLLSNNAAGDIIVLRNTNSGAASFNINSRSNDVYLYLTPSNSLRTAYLKMARDGRLYLNIDGNDVGILTGSSSSSFQNIWNVGVNQIISDPALDGGNGATYFFNNGGLASTYFVQNWDSGNISIGNGLDENAAPPAPTSFSGTIAKSQFSLSGSDSVTRATHTYYLRTSAGAITMTLPAVSGTAGTEYEFKDKDGSAATNPFKLATTGGATIDGKAGYTNAVNYGSVLVRTDGTNWFIH